MQPALPHFLFGLPVFRLSLLGALFWLSIPLLLQVIVDKVLLRNSADTLNILGIALLLTTLLASVLEIGLKSLIHLFVRSQVALRETLLNLAAALPRVILLASVLLIYSLHVAVVAIVLTAIACGAYYIINKIRPSGSSGVSPLPLSFRLPLTLIVLFVLWSGASLVLSGQFTLGQWLAIGIMSLEFAACLLSLVAIALRGW